MEQLLGPNEVPEDLIKEFQEISEILPNLQGKEYDEFTKAANIAAAKGKEVAEAADNKTIVLVIADESYLHLYQNFYETSIIKYSLPALSIALDENSYK